MVTWISCCNWRKETLRRWWRASGDELTRSRINYLFSLEILNVLYSGIQVEDWRLKYINHLATPELNHSRPSLFWLSLFQAKMNPGWVRSPKASINLTATVLCDRALFVPKSLIPSFCPYRVITSEVVREWLFSLWAVGSTLRPVSPTGWKRGRRLDLGKNISFSDSLL